MQSFSICLAITLESVFNVQLWTPMAHNLRSPNSTTSYSAILLVHLSVSVIEPPQNDGFVSQDHIRGSSAKRECANTHIQAYNAMYEVQVKIISYSVPYDDTTNVTWARGPIATAAHEIGHNTSQQSRSGTCLLRL
jgi:hypothetical protein